MPLILCDKCKEKHIDKDEDILYKIYCVHTYEEIKQKYLQDKKYKPLAKRAKTPT